MYKRLAIASDEDRTNQNNNCIDIDRKMAQQQFNSSSHYCFCNITTSATTTILYRRRHKIFSGCSALTAAFIVLSAFSCSMIFSPSSSSAAAYHRGVVGYVQPYIVRRGQRLVRIYDPTIDTNHRRSLMIGNERICVTQIRQQGFQQSRRLFASNKSSSSNDNGIAKTASNTNNNINSSRINNNNNNNNNNNINVISSPQSTTIKKVLALLKKRKKRTEYQQTIVEGPRIVFDLLQNPNTFPLVRQILISTDDFFDANNYESRLMPILTSNGSLSSSSLSVPQIQLVASDVFYHCCSDTVTPQGIAAIVDIPEPKIERNDKEDDDEYGDCDGRNRAVRVPFYLLLDGLADPGNTGTLIRSCLAAGVTGILLLPGCCDVWNPKSVRSAMGASFQIPIWQFSSWDDAVEFLQDKLQVSTIYAATMIDGFVNNADDEGNDYGGGRETLSSVPYYDIDWMKGSSALIIGSEGNGLSLEVRNAIGRTYYSQRNTENDQDVQNQQPQELKVMATHIPMQPGIESLNAAVCGSIIMFEYSRQQAAADGMLTR